MNINRLKDLAQSILDDYKSQANGTKRWLQDYRKETQTYKEYRGREIFELLQNADDAESDRVDIRVNLSERLLTISNSGAQTIPFTEDGIQSIMLSDLSPKKGKKMIGAKGLGFRSVLNWTDRIEIRSANISLKFGNDIVTAQWCKFKDTIINAEQYELEAQKDGRKVPLAILALPVITEIDGTQNATSITLIYDDDYEQGIIDDLKNFQPESLLFLHSIKQVNISIGEEFVQNYSKQTIKEDGDIVETELNGHHWIQADSSGMLSESKDEYKVSCAFCLDDQKETYNIFSFFPTQIEFPLPCILHATLELDSSRNSLLPSNKNNLEMMEKLTEQIAVIAEYLKQSRHDWCAYMLMKPDNTKPTKNEYINRLLSIIHHLSTGRAYIPTLNGSFVNENEYYYYADSFYDLISRDDAKEIFPHLRLNDAPKYAVLNRQDPKIKYNIEQYARLIASDLNLLSELITTLLTLKNKQSQKFNILRDSKRNVIDGSSYINTGMEVEDIPDFREIRYVDDALVTELKERLNLHGKEPDRDLVAKLKDITDVSATDVSVVTRNLIPKASDKELSLEKKKELLTCLFKLFLKRSKDSFTKSDSTIFLISESDEWSQANTLVMSDKRFPKGFANLNIKRAYQPSSCAKYPDFLEQVEEATPNLIQDFYAALGAKLYLKTEKVYYGDDTNYLELFNLKNEVIQNCGSGRDHNERNSAYITDNEMLKSLDLYDLIKVLSASPYCDDICDNQQIHWFLNCYKTPEIVPMSYIAFNIRCKTKAEELKYYAIEDDEWLPGIFTKEKTAFNRDYSTKILLEKLGAKKHLSDFSTEYLYNAINQQENQWESPYVGAQAFYHSIKQALDSKDNSPALPDGKSLRMLCTINESYEFRDSREIYYSDNNELPNDVLKSLPMLVMRRREGELKVKRLFGCRTLKDIKICITGSSENDTLTRELSRQLENRKPYILAFASLGVGRRGANTATLYNDEFKKLLKSFSIITVRSADYQYDINSQTVLNTNNISMKEGELLCTDQKFYICSQCTSLSEVMSKPEFNNAVVEALCIKLNLSSSEIANQFYRIFTSNDKDLNFYRKQEIEQTLWHECENQFGMASTDVEFWREVFATNGINFDVSTLCTEKTSYLQQELKVNPERLTSPECFVLYHRQQLEEIQSKYINGYLWSIYKEIKEDSTLHHKYLQRQAPFRSNDWLEAILTRDKNKYRIKLDYEALLCIEMKNCFNYIPSEPIEKTGPAKKTDYLQSLDEFNLSDDAKSLLYFDGHKEYFNKLKASNENGANHVLPSDKTDNIILPIHEFKMDTKDPFIGKSKKFSAAAHGKPQKRKISDNRKAQLGNDAERRVYEALSKSDIYDVGPIYSSYLANYASKASGDDSKGYDLEYRKKNEVLFRYLEIKYSDGKSIILSENEYEVSQRSDNKNRYDLALVTDDEIRIIRNAFADSSNFNKVPNDYTIYFTTSKL